MCVTQEASLPNATKIRSASASCGVVMLQSLIRVHRDVMLFVARARHRVEALDVEFQRTPARRGVQRR